jgi:hypothetical protein
VAARVVAVCGRGVFFENVKLQHGRSFKQMFFPTAWRRRS